MDVDNGYDAFTLDNSRTSHSDAMGEDTLETNAFALKSTYQVNPKMHLVSKLDWSDTDSKYSYDNDWSYAGEILDELDPGNQEVPQYVGSDSYTRNVKNVAIDVRLVSDEDGRIFNDTTDWTVGAYYQDKKQTLDRLEKYYEDTYYWGVYGESTNLETEYKTKSTALYGQLDTALSSKLTLVSGLRVENWDAKYSDEQLKIADYEPDEYTTVNIDHDEVLYGGKLGLNYQYDEKTLFYTSLSRGYKPGGVNIDLDVLELDPSLKTYETEILWNIEAGVNSSHFNDKLKSRLNLFYAKRKDQQIETSLQDGASFSEYISNAAKGHNYGLESEIDYYPTDSLHLYSNIGLLQTEFDEYNNPDPAVDLEGRDQAQSPNYQFNVGLDYNFASNWIINTNVEGKGDYYFNESSNQKIDSYHIFNTALGYTGDNWSATLWVRNMTDKDYDVKGYYFDNKISNPNGDTEPAKDPRWNDKEVYTQKGAPRTVGFTVAYDF